MWLLGGAAVAWPRAARAPTMPGIGFFSLGSPRAFAIQLPALRIGAHSLMCAEALPATAAVMANDTQPARPPRGVPHETQLKPFFACDETIFRFRF
jgi:hypothetical protein